ncbi:hypothetical protein M422DRAFT_274442 [Sphaerobolus stellatus SS14]|uniref:Uncharacterized protein n=1 Tax=Sphaerobolus stellatus (strain SS14) TaxID=990650 RepID=A0A0C9TS58_SPHS4|nr:hypothetical protein M422DRAFT_274442 [Sphaerobolus stellatus SS14]
MSDNANANNTEPFPSTNPPPASHLPLAKAGTIRSASDRTPFEQKDPAKKLKALDLANYLDQDIDLPPSPTRSTTKGPVLLGADILSHLPKKSCPDKTLGSASPSILFDIFMPQASMTQGVSEPSGGTAPLPQGISGTSNNPHPQATDSTEHPPPLDRIPASDTIQEHVHPNSAYPLLVQGLSEGEARTLKNEFVLVNEEVATFFYPYDTALPITDYAVSLKGLVLTPSPQNDAQVATKLVRFLNGTAEVIQFITQHNENIPFDEVPDPHNFVPWTLSTLRVLSSLVKHRNTGPIPIHNIFIHPPTTEPAGYKSWISLLHRLHYDTRKGIGKPTTAELCNVCKSVAHSDEDCKYAAIPGWPATAPSSQPQTSGPQGGSLPRGRGRGGNQGRGRGSRTNSGWA